MWKIQSGEVCEFCMLLYYARKSVTTFRNVVKLFRASYKSIQKSQTSHDCILHILRYLATKLHNFTKFVMLFPAVLMNFPNSKVSLIGEWSIALYSMQCKLTKQEQRLETSRKSNMASGMSSVNFPSFFRVFLHFELKINNLHTRRV